MHNAVKRRTFLRSAIGFPVAVGLTRYTDRALSAEPEPKSATNRAGLIVRQASPANLEMPMNDLTDFITPNENFFVRNHFEVPTIEPGSWRLSVTGSVDKPLDFTLEDLKKMTAQTVTATLECSGNGRAFLNPKKTGVQWEQGAVGNAKWTGVPLAALLDHAQIRKDAVDVVLVGADSGETKDGLKTSFVRSIPLKKAMRSDTLLAYAMNNSDLPRNHGFPLRAVVPGWYGVASVKWLTRVFVADRVFRSYFQSLDYTIWRRDGGLANLAPITSMLVKSIIATPAAGTKLGLGKDVVVSGAAWTGDGEIAKVEVSSDEGRTWSPAKLQGDSVRDAWRLWQFNWRTPSSPGKLTLRCRATDSAGNVQPRDRDDDRRNYLINHIIPVPVEIG